MNKTVFLLCFASVSIFAQDDILLPVPPVPPVVAVPAIEPIPPRTPAVPAPAELPELLVKTVVPMALAQAKQAVEKVKADVARAHADVAMEMAGDGNFLLSRGAKPGRTLIIPGRDFSESTGNALEQDLNVMSRILEKAVERKSDDDHPKAMGIDVFSMGSSSGVRNLYLDGYGALFILKVRFPLTPPPKKTEENKTNEAINSTWAETHRELYGPRTEWNEFGKGFHKAFGSPPEEYDADKVARLKDSILEALKNAANIRHLKSDERVTVAVTGGIGSADGFSKRVTSESRAGSGRITAYEAGSRAGDRRDESATQSVLTIQARKSEIDSLAKGKLTAEEFRKKAIVILN